MIDYRIMVDMPSSDRDATHDHLSYQFKAKDDAHALYIAESILCYDTMTMGVAYDGDLDYNHRIDPSLTPWPELAYRLTEFDPGPGYTLTGRLERMARVVHVDLYTQYRLQNEELAAVEQQREAAKALAKAQSDFEKAMGGE